MSLVVCEPLLHHCHADKIPPPPCNCSGDNAIGCLCFSGWLFCLCRLLNVTFAPHPSHSLLSKTPTKRPFGSMSTRHTFLRPTKTANKAKPQRQGLCVITPRPVYLLLSHVSPAVHRLRSLPLVSCHSSITKRLIACRRRVFSAPR